jgi:hypothetical protein
MVLGLSVIERVAFVATNAGYWYLVSLMVFGRYRLGADTPGWPCTVDALGGVCTAVCTAVATNGVAVVPSVLLVVVALASTSMHTAQMRVCPSCVFSAGDVEWFHEPQTVATLRKLDVSCVLIVLAVGGACVGWVRNRAFA